MATTSKLIDVDVLAIFLVEDHPGHRYVDPVVSAGLAGGYRLLVPGDLPLQARWLLTAEWGVPAAEADRAIEDFLEQRRVRYVSPDRGTLQAAFALARRLRCDVADAAYLALARAHGASAFVTTDAGLRTLCEKAGIAYENPIPRAVLAEFAAEG